MRLRFRLAGLALVATSALAATVSATPAADAGTPRPMLVGLTDTWKTQVQNDEAQLGGIHSGIVGLFLPWSRDPYSQGGYNWLNWVRSRGAAPMLDLYPAKDVTLYAIAHGHQDTYLFAWARAFRQFGHPALFRLFPEMNQNHSYTPTTAYQQKQFIMAWRHVWRLFHGQVADSSGRYVNASNVKFVWNPYRPLKGSVPLPKLWPGATYVDWSALDIYNFADTKHGTHSAYALTKPAIALVRKVTSKPLLIPELGTAPRGPESASYYSKARWIKAAYPALQSLGVRAVVWFDEESPGTGVNWRYDSSPASLDAARAALTQTSVVATPSRASMSEIDTFVSTRTASWG